MTLAARLALLVVASVASASLGCAAEEQDELVGARSDGLTVVCSPEGAGRYACDPDEDSGAGAGNDGAVDDACASWTDAGPALVLWPPNHRLETVTLEDCASARAGCEVAESAARDGRIVAVTSDEPLDANGDGETGGDLTITGERSVDLRSERQGGGDGRVYRIELEDAQGRTDVCEVHVPHDRGPHGGAQDSGEATRVEAVPR